MDARHRHALSLPTVTFFDRRARRALPGCGGTTRALSAAPRRDVAGPLVRAGVSALLILVAGYSFSCLSVLVQEFEFRRDADAVRDRLVALDAEPGDVSPEDVVVAVRDVADVTGVEVGPGDVEVVAAPVEVRGAAGRRCSVGALPSEFDQLSVEDRRRFDGSPVPCDETRWIIGFRAEVRASSWLRSSRFTVERYTWVDGFSMDGGEVVAAR